MGGDAYRTLYFVGVLTDVIRRNGRATDDNRVWGGSEWRTKNKLRLMTMAARVRPGTSKGIWLRYEENALPASNCSR